jgi:hypothetical protein
MLPEISRRCRSCGAAVRARGRFCPQCGQVMSEGDAAEGESSPQSAHAADAPTRGAESQKLGGDGARVVGVEQPNARRAVPETGEAAGPSAQPAPPAQSTPPAPAAAIASAAEPPQEVESADGIAGEERLGRVARVREGTRARVENTRARVERVRDDALVALEETPDDSGMRFVIVAVFLFALFLLFLFLSTTVLR